MGHISHRRDNAAAPIVLQVVTTIVYSRQASIIVQTPTQGTMCLQKDRVVKPRVLPESTRDPPARALASNAPMVITLLGRQPVAHAWLFMDGAIVIGTSVGVTGQIVTPDARTHMTMTLALTSGGVSVHAPTNVQARYSIF